MTFKLTLNKELANKELGEATELEERVIFQYGKRLLLESKRWKQQEIKGFRRIFKVVTSDSYRRRLKRIGNLHDGNRR